MSNQPSVRTEVLKQSDKLRFARSLCFLPACFTETLWKPHRSAHMFWFISDCHSIGLHRASCSLLKVIYRKRSWLNKADSCVHWEVIRFSKELGHALLSHWVVCISLSCDPLLKPSHRVKTGHEVSWYDDSLILVCVVFWFNWGMMMWNSNIIKTTQSVYTQKLNHVSGLCDAREINCHLFYEKLKWLMSFFFRCVIIFQLTTVMSPCWVF